MKPTSPAAQEKPEKKLRPAGRQALAPPEERFWIRYSPHHELPLSTISSVAIHVLVIGLILVAAWVYYWLGLKHQNRSLPVEAVSIVGGGGGSPQGIGDGPGTRTPGAPEAVDPPPLDREKPPAAPPPDKLNPVQPAPLQLPEIKDPNVRRLIEQGSEAVASINQLNQETRARLAKGLRAGQGQGGGGSDGGKDRGKDKGEGSGVGPGKGTITQREKRVLRWVMIFNTLNGEDYARQLQGLGAIVAIPEPGQPDKYLVIRDLLRRPANPQPEDLSEIKRIYWVDNKPASVDALAKALQLKQFPGHFVAFFPEALEQKLLERELKYRGRAEDDIQETKFEVRRVGSSYEPHVTDQKSLR